MTLKESSIYVNLKALRRLLFQSQFLMDKGSRTIYGSRIIEESMQTMRYFVLAFTVKEKRVQFLQEMAGWFEVLKADLDFCMESNLIHFKKKTIKHHEKDEDETAYISGKKIELFTLIARLDDDMCKWRSSISGKTIIE